MARKIEHLNIKYHTRDEIVADLGKFAITMFAASHYVDSIKHKLLMSDVLDKLDEDITDIGYRIENLIFRIEQCECEKEED